MRVLPAENSFFCAMLLALKHPSGSRKTFSWKHVASTKQNYWNQNCPTLASFRSLKNMWNTLQQWSIPCINWREFQNTIFEIANAKKHLKFWRRASPSPEVWFSMAGQYLRNRVFLLANKQWLQFSPKFGIDQKVPFWTYLKPSSKLRADFLLINLNFQLLGNSQDVWHVTCMGKVSKTLVFIQLCSRFNCFMTH